MAVDLVEEEPERELLEPEDEELGLTRWALGASASSLQTYHKNKNNYTFYYPELLLQWLLAEVAKLHLSRSLSKAVGFPNSVQSNFVD